MLSGKQEWKKALQPQAIDTDALLTPHIHSRTDIKHSHAQAVCLSADQTTFSIEM